MSQADLTKWALQGLVLPGSEVSQDKETWAPADTIPGAQMEWIATLDNGQAFGPFNLRSAPHIIRRGLLKAGTTIENRVTGKKMPLKGAGKPDAAGGKPEQSPKQSPAEKAAQVGAKSEAQPGVESIKPGPDTAPAAEAPSPAIEVLSRFLKFRAKASPKPVIATVPENASQPLLQEIKQEAARVKQSLQDQAMKIPETTSPAVASTPDLKSKETDDNKAAEAATKAQQKEPGSTESEMKVTLPATAGKQAMPQVEERKTPGVQPLDEECAVASAPDRENKITEADAGGSAVCIEELEKQKERFARLEETKRAREAELAHCIEILEKQVKEAIEERAPARPLPAVTTADIEETALRTAMVERGLRTRILELEALNADMTGRTESLQLELNVQKRLVEAAAVNKEVQVELSAEIARARQDAASATVALDEAKAELEKMKEHTTALEEGYRTRELELTRRLTAAEEQVKSLAEARERAGQEAEKLSATCTEIQSRAERREAELLARISELEKTAAAEVRVIGSAPVPATASELSDWYMKTADDTVYGPISWADLCDWVAQSRVAPEDQLSKDRSEWSAASGIPELRMDWMVTLVDGTDCGPLNLPAIYQMISDGGIQVDPVLVNKASGEKMPLMAASGAEIAAMQIQCAALKVEKCAADRNLAIARQECMALQSARQEVKQAAQEHVPAVQQDVVIAPEDNPVDLTLPPQSVRRKAIDLLSTLP